MKKPVILKPLEVKPEIKPKTAVDIFLEEKGHLLKQIVHGKWKEFNKRPKLKPLTKHKPELYPELYKEEIYEKIEYNFGTFYIN